MSSQNRQLAAILFTDIVGYTALMQKDEGNAVSMVRRYIEVLQRAVPGHGGEVLNDYGDGSLCTFSSATQAVKCAIFMQQQLMLEPGVPLRIGLHIGEIFFEGGKVMGDGVNVASRIQSMGQANAILYSKEIFDKIRNQPEFKSVSLGFFEFKNVGEPMEVFALANEGLTVPLKKQMEGKLKSRTPESGVTKKQKWAMILFFCLIVIASLFAYRQYFHRSVAGKEKTIAVLPFKNNSAEKEQNQPFCVGVVLELQKKLAWIGGLIPIDPQSVEKYRDTKMSIADIASELGGIRYILQGTVQRDKNKVKVFASLVDAEDGKELWSDDYPGDVEDIFTLQENIAQKIAEELKIKISPQESERIARIPTKSTAAFDAYNEAMTSYSDLVSAIHPLYWDSLESNGPLYAKYLKTLALCDQVIKIDPAMAEAYILKGKIFYYNYSNWSSQPLKYELLLDTVALWTNKGLEIDKTAIDGYVMISKYYEGKSFFIKENSKSGVSISNDSAFIYLEKAFAINANNFDVNWELGNYYKFRDPEKSIRFLKKAIRLNPLSFWTPVVYRDLAFPYHTICDFNKAEFYYKKALEISKNSVYQSETFHWLTNLYLHWGKADSVYKYSEQWLKVDKNALYQMAEADCNLKNDCEKAAEKYQELW
ncbi:MAG: adenylate/guanylate cyclase domain-containing protein, partial [Ginsengibacter sp.]